MDAVVKALVERYGFSVRLDVAASIAGFSEDEVRELRRPGRFPGHRAGTKVMVFVPELVEWMRSGGEGQYEPAPAAADAIRATAPLQPRRKAIGQRGWTACARTHRRRSACRPCRLGAYASDRKPSTTNRLRPSSLSSSTRRHRASSPASTS
jgi:hypothetical protein